MGQRCLFLFDGYGGQKLEQNMMRSILTHHGNFVIVTAKPDCADEKVHEFIRNNRGYTLLSSASTRMPEKARTRSVGTHEMAEAQPNATPEGILISGKAQSNFTSSEEISIPAVLVAREPRTRSLHSQKIPETSHILNLISPVVNIDTSSKPKSKKTKCRISVSFLPQGYMQKQDQESLSRNTLAVRVAV